MDRNRKQDTRDEVLPDRPGLASQDWQDITSGAAKPKAVFENGDIRYEDEPDRQLPEEDDDNPYQESDEALPHEGEERAIGRDADKIGERPGRS